MTSLSALFNFKSLTSFPTFNISASKSELPVDGAAGTGAFGVGAAGTEDGLFSFKEIIVKLFNFNFLHL